MEELPDYENIYIPTVEIDESGFAYDGKTGEPLGQMFGHRTQARASEISEDEIYSFWIRCTCGYRINEADAVFCGGCGSPIRLPDVVRKALERPEINHIQFDGQQWRAYGRSGEETLLRIQHDGVTHD